MDINDDLDEIDGGEAAAAPFGNLKGGVLNLIRTTQRNYINLTNIADNKANILISINSIMLTVLIPITLANLNIIVSEHLYIPLVLFAITGLLTIVYAAKVLSPFSNKKAKLKYKDSDRSPFFFVDYADLSLDQYKELFETTIASKEKTNDIIVSDLYHFGINLAIKYNFVSIAYQIFNKGMVITFATFIIILLF